MKYKTRKTNLTKYTSCKTDAEKKRILKFRRLKKFFLLITLIFSLIVATKNSGILNCETITKIASFPSDEGKVFISLTKIIKNKLSLTNTIGKYGSKFCFDYLNTTKANTVNAAKAENNLTKPEPLKNPLSHTESISTTVQSDITESSSVENVFLAQSPCKGTVTSAFGERIHPVNGTLSFHNGIDIGANEGDGVYSVCDGIIKTAEYNEFSGNYIIITHTDGYTSSYAHMSSLSVTEGMTVNKGNLIGYVGSTGNVTGPHLHIEIRKDGSPVDPEDYFVQE